MQIQCRISHEETPMIDRAGRPYTFRYTQVFAADTGLLLMARGKCISSADQSRGSAMANAEKQKSLVIDTQAQTNANEDQVASRSLSAILKDITHEALVAVVSEEALHFRYQCSTWVRWCAWWRGAVAGALASREHLPLTTRLARMLRSTFTS